MHLLYKTWHVCASRLSIQTVACGNESLQVLLACLGPLSSVLGSGLISLRNALGIECTSDDVITHTGEVLNSTASDENYRVFLKIVSDTGDIGCNFVTVGELYSGDLSHSRVRLLGGSGSYSSADASLLR